MYADVRDKILKVHPWTFAEKRISLAKVITGATQVNPVVITSVAHGLSNENEVKITGVIGMTELNGNTYKIANKATDTFELTDPDDDSNIDGTSFTEYSSGGFARKINTLAWDDDGLNIVYDLPSDYLRANIQSDPWAWVKIEGQKLLSNVEELKIGYTYKLDDPTIYTAEFTLAFATLLASELAFSLTESTSKAKALVDKYNNITLPDAQSADSQQGTARNAQADLWEFARRSGTGLGIRGRPGMATWHPINWWC